MDSKEDGFGYSACQEESNKSIPRSVRSSLEDRGPVKVYLCSNFASMVIQKAFSMCLNGPRPMKFF